MCGVLLAAACPSVRSQEAGLTAVLMSAVVEPSCTIDTDHGSSTRVVLRCGRQALQLARAETKDGIGLVELRETPTTDARDPYRLALLAPVPLAIVASLTPLAFGNATLAEPLVVTLQF
jgi:hypothetical protein